MFFFKLCYLFFSWHVRCLVCSVYFPHILFLEIMPKKTTKSHYLYSELWSRWHLALHAIFMPFCRIINVMSYLTISVYVTILEPFVAPLMWSFLLNFYLFQVTTNGWQVKGKPKCLNKVLSHKQSEQSRHSGSLSLFIFFNLILKTLFWLKMNKK